MTSAHNSPTAKTSSADTTDLDSTPTLDLVCIGFGPAQLAVAIANRESRKPAKVLFLERKPEFSWHSAGHTPRTRMEDPFIYDLATVRNPRSAFTYVNYLLSRKRLIEFANSDRLNPLREEFADYLRWCASKFKDEVRYGSEVLHIKADTVDGVVRGWNVSVKNNASETYSIRARNVIAPFPTSQNAHLSPPTSGIELSASQSIISTEEYFSRRDELRGSHEPRLEVTIVGSGISTAEILDDLLSCSRLGNITVVTDDDMFAPLRILGGCENPPPKLCSLWAKPRSDKKDSLEAAPELIQRIYMRAYEKRILSKSQYGLCIASESDVAKACAKSCFIIRDTTTAQFGTTKLLNSLDTLALGCESRGDSLGEVKFKRGLVDASCRVLLMSARSDGGRSLAKDIAITAGQAVKMITSGIVGNPEGSLVHARM